MTTVEKDILGPDDSSLLLRAMIEELTNQINALERSQRELAVALVEEPDDADFLAAVQENEVILMRKREELVNMQQQLFHTDIAYRQEKLAESRSPQASSIDNYGNIVPGNAAEESREGNADRVVTEAHIHNPSTPVQSDGLYI
jgi:hypothetical protein